MAFTLIELLVVIATPRTSAATITWGSATTVKGDTDVATNGALVYAYDESNVGQAVNGVSLVGGSSPYALGGGDVTFWGFDGGVYVGYGPAASGSISAGYSNILTGGAWSSSAGSGTVTLNNLTPGRDYEVQCWVDDYRSYGTGRSETFSGNNVPTLGYNPGQYAIGMFTADGTTTQPITLTANASVQLNALQVRDVTTVQGPKAGGWASPTNLVIGQSAFITVTVTNGTFPIITNVTLDASQLGQALPVVLNPAGSNVFTNTVTVGVGTIYSNLTLPVTVMDGGGQQGQAGIAVYLPTPAAHGTPAADLQTWQSNRFGMFIHWGPVTLTGLEISWSRANSNPNCPNDGPTPVDVYDSLYTEFNPTNFDASNWVAVAQAAGMNYMVLTAKHADGFLLWDSQASDYNIMNSPFHRDVCGELAAAAHAAGMKLGWYFSPCDWKDPRFRTPKNAAFVKTMQAELRELLSNYGKIDILWFDWDGGTNCYDVTNTYAMCRSLQPDIVIDNRLDLGVNYNGPMIGPWADYYTPEQYIGGFNNQQPWETCMTLGTQWAWKPDDTLKSLPQCLSNLLLCAGGDGNYLLDLGPMPTGAFDQSYSDTIAGMGAWLAQNGESVYGTRGGPYLPAVNFASTRNGNYIYIHLLPPQSNVTLSALPTNILSASVLTGGSVTFTQTTQSVALQLSPDAVTNTNLVATVKLTLAGSAMDIPVLPAGTSYSYLTPNNWQAPQTITSSSEVITRGSLVIARQATGSDFGGYSDQTVNGVTFLGNVNMANGATFTVGGQSGYDPTTFISTKTFSGPDAAAYEEMLAGGWYGNTSPVTLGLDGLTNGHDYLIQIWVDDFRAQTNARSETVTVAAVTDTNAPTLLYSTGDGTDPGSGTGQFVVGTFIAAGSSLTFNLTGNQSSQLNAFQLRDITPPSPPHLTWSVSATNLTFSWPAGYIGWTLMVQTNLAQGVSANPKDWIRIEGTSATNQFAIPLTGTSPMEFYKLVFP
ncbi:MAG TPA: alpha-L-fucosidase [Verrucomicrobiae bacterium]|nr:alpha-L-fucosidase [Verrucomicrobiae bacterium]